VIGDWRGLFWELLKLEENGELGVKEPALSVLIVLKRLLGMLTGIDWRLTFQNNKIKYGPYNLTLPYCKPLKVVIKIYRIFL